MTPERQEFVRKLGEASAGYRKRKAEVLDTLGREREVQRFLTEHSLQTELFPDNWHTARARGERNRASRALNCGRRQVRIRCGACRSAFERPELCKLPLWCVRCRGVAAADRRRRFLDAREVVLQDAGRRGLLTKHSYKRWTEKMLTLTFPHDPRLSVQGRIEVAFAVWTEFLRKFNSWKKKNKSNSVRWFRAFEWEPGSDGKGHPHFHVWLFCPFLERVAIERWLKDSYSLVTGEIAPETLAFDIRMLTGTDKDAREIIKYITKDIDAKGNIIDPELFAQVYEVVDGKRTTQASRGFMGLAKKSVPCSCGASNCWEVEVINDTKAVE